MISLIQVAYAERPLCDKAEPDWLDCTLYSKAAIIEAKMTALSRAQHAAPKNAMSNAND
jgi:hypothetical protein